MWSLFLVALACTKPVSEGAKPGDTAVDDLADADADGFSVAEGDCDDTNADVAPGAAEVCDGLDQDCDGTIDEDVLGTWYADADADGFGDPAAPITACDAPDDYVQTANDCDDADAEIHPGAAEICDGVDQDCDGSIDEELLRTYYADTDGDGYGDPASVQEACDVEDGWVTTAGDCDDATAEAYPGRPEACDELDNNCDGVVDEGVTTLYFEDRDGDGYGVDGSTEAACSVPTGYAPLPGDCNDADRAWNPGASEACDDPRDFNCDGSVGYADADADGWAACEDCNDAAADVRPDSTEICNEIDDDCDGLVDDDDPSRDRTTAIDWYADTDLDGYGTGLAVRACDAPTGAVSLPGDCDDTSAATRPTGAEVCNDRDDDCDALIDDADTSLDLSTATDWYADADGDRYGDPDDLVRACDATGGRVGDATDCDDTRAGVNPVATEVCNDLDDDCDALIDDADPSRAAWSTTRWYLDLDGDGYGDAAAPQDTCDSPLGYVANSTDCDDTRATVNPAATEICNDLDDDCDRATDDADASLARSTATAWYADGDRDGYGNPSVTSVTCDAPAGYIAAAGDCNDSAAAVNPAAREVCDSIDNDCDRATDDADASLDTSTGSAWYADSDRDGYGNAGDVTRACLAPSGRVANSTDCDDAAVSVNPAATELCNDLDDDCDALVDDADPTLAGFSTSRWYADLDGDGYGDPTSPRNTCDSPVGYVANALDCNDAAASISPAATEVCNDRDDDCDGSIDDSDSSLSVASTTTWYADSDRDGYGTNSTFARTCDAPTGYVATAGDCNDGAVAISPAATEVCDSVDNDCDGRTDDADSSLSAASTSSWYTDADGDGYGSGTATRACLAPAGTVAVSTDCDDSTSGTYPGAPESWDCTDQDCDGNALPTGDGRDGTYTATGAVLSPTATALIGGAAVGARSLSVSSSSGFSAGDLVLVYDVRGTGAGTWEVVTVSSVSSGTLNLRGAVSRAFSSSDTNWVQRIPQYSTVTVGSGQTLYAPAYAGTGTPGGGVVAFVARTLTLAGTVNASGRGYRGGARTSSRTQIGEQGESYSGSQSRSTSANGLGGGGGYSVSLTHADGGGGGYRSAGATGGTIGGWGNTAGSGGGTAGAANLSSLLMGGGGGSGSLDSDAEGGSYGGYGGAGGGIVLVSAGSLSLTGTITVAGANGETGYYAGGAASPGGGGAGAGGSIYLGAGTVTSATGSLRATGGSGGTGTEAGASATTGGAGGNGGIRVQSSTTLSASPSAYATCP